MFLPRHQKATSIKAWMNSFLGRGADPRRGVGALRIGAQRTFVRKVSPEKTVLLVIDVQGKLAYLMHEKDEFIRHVAGLVRVADILDIPVLFTEQAPEKIGTTIPEVAGSFNGRKPIAKHSFSCCGEKEFMRQLEALDRRQVIVAGIEAHVCISQTVRDLLGRHYEAQVVSDAVSSRSEADKECALERVRAWGAEVTSTEMVACELLRTSEHEKFKEIINLIK